MTQITVIRKIISYEEMVFGDEQEFEEWKTLATCESDLDYQKFVEFNKNNFKDIEYSTEGITPTTYVALNGDQTLASDDWIFWGIFDESKEEDELNTLSPITSVNQDDYQVADYMNYLLTQETSNSPSTNNDQDV